MSVIYRKTAKGQTEIETRVNRLLPRLRQALILVDGRKTDAELAKLVLAEPAAALEALLAAGYIEVIATLADEPAAQNPAPAAAVAARKTASAENIRRDAVRYLNDKLGPAAEGIALKLERAKTMPEIRPLLVNAGQLLRSISGRAVAEEFAARFLSSKDA